MVHVGPLSFERVKQPSVIECVSVCAETSVYKDCMIGYGRHGVHGAPHG
uniref:Uncharacterized protein n=1 Tax=Anguilla anguilla TaxID=7936 RepID=A0A0E9VFV1_ANGAN